MTDDDFNVIEAAIARLTDDFTDMGALTYTQAELAEWLRGQGDERTASRVEALPAFRTTGEHDGSLAVHHGPAFGCRTWVRRP